MDNLGLFVVGLVVVAFGAVGFIRGWRREVVALTGLVVGWAAVIFGGQLLVFVVDRVYLVVASTVRGIFDSPDPGGILRSLRASPLVDPAHPEPLYAVVFAVVVVVVYGFGTRAAPGPDGLPSQLLGIPIGLMNGYLLAWALLSYAAPFAVGRALASTTSLVGRYSTHALALSTLVVAALALLSLRSRARGGRAARPARARGR